MTNKTAAFTFKETNTGPQISQVTLGLSPVDTETAQKATAIMTGVFERIVGILKDKHTDKYDGLMASKELKISFDLPEKDEIITITVFNGKKILLNRDLSKANSHSLKETLTTFANSTKATTLASSAYLPTSQQQDLLLKGSTVNTNKSLATGARSTKASSNPLLKGSTVNTNKPLTTGVSSTSEPQTAQVTPPTHTIVYQFFAAIIDWLMSFFETTVYPPLIPKNSEENARDYTQTKTGETQQVVAPFRPLRNGNNICFINAIFQALVNMLDTPELRKVLIEAHQAKIEREAGEIDDLELEIALEESKYWFSSSADRPLLEQLKASREASMTLNQALRTYKTGTNNFVWLDALRGFDPTFGGGSQEDAHDLLVRIFDPLLEPLRNGIDAHDKMNIGTIPKDINPDVRKSLSRFIPMIGEEKQLMRVVREDDAEAIRALELAALENAEVSPLPPGGLRQELVAGSSIQFAVPAERTSLEALVTGQLKMHKLAEQDGTSVYVENGIRGDYQVSQKRIVIGSLENPPEFLTFHLKRFECDKYGKMKKIKTPITFPSNNMLPLIVDGENVNYEIHTVLVHDGDSPRSGHYYSYVRNNGAWIELNDSRVAPLAQLPKTVENEAYMVFLKRVH